MIYFIQAGEGGPFKIGFAKNAERRLAQLQTGNHRKLSLVFSCPGDHALENRIHRDLDEYRGEGEWFGPPEVVWQYIAGLREIEYEVGGDRNWAILRRDTMRSKTDHCPFCGARHIHGTGDGHRRAHCVDGVESVTAKDGTALYRTHGYILKTRRR